MLFLYFLIQIYSDTSAPHASHVSRVAIVQVNTSRVKSTRDKRKREMLSGMAFISHSYVDFLTRYRRASSRIEIFENLRFKGNFRSIDADYGDSRVAHCSTFASRSSHLSFRDSELD